MPVYGSGPSLSRAAPDVWFNLKGTRGGNERETGVRALLPEVQPVSLNAGGDVSCFGDGACMTYLSVAGIAPKPPAHCHHPKEEGEGGDSDGRESSVCFWLTLHIGGWGGSCKFTFSTETPD